MKKYFCLCSEHIFDFQGEGNKEGLVIQLCVGGKEGPVIQLYVGLHWVFTR